MAELPNTRFDAGETIFHRGEPGDHAYLIRSGQVEISTDQGGKKVVIANLGPGEVFGELALISHQARTATATTTRDTEATVISTERLQAAIDSADPLLQTLLRGNLGRFIWTQRFMLQHASPKSEDSSLAHQAERDRNVEAEIGRAIKTREFELFYQPIVDLEKGHIAGFEALMRWRHPDRGTVSPGEFIGVAEATGQIVAMGAWALEEALEQLKGFQAIVDQQALDEQPPLFMSVNVSGRQLLELDEIEHLGAVLKQSGVAPERIKLEITESLLVDDPMHAAIALQQLRDLGVRLAIDDFGTGYSSLSYLHLFPLDTLKIDRSFVQDMIHDPRRERIVRAISGLARDLDLNIIAEGVENEEELASLNRFECDYVQGFLMAKPQTADQIRQLLAGAPRFEVPRH
ncbi:EAL domain-containing protein (putative c-di-GMP-specific phosphodiesterase class I) [Natronospira proteinivora]|uniref:EAL domain-containing protein (Putative c-di-GMP-specific phosphodiesterase class I) n=1 Tax=Natronospira proteinivora TaxID=1807133 RepID=A0ABT1G945_9GAMM|nr:EAL domain-containing protein [Natronospira proteinivora]MCP1727824.1 EAL domain-containing protein (putative c-di-GMP-specific phosphodiesterase class I) [Natronospira proteinivora]